jgi:hypothetical protein
VIWSLAATGCSRIVWRPDLGGAMQLAARENRIVVVAYWSAINGDCDRMEYEVFASPDVYDTMTGTVPVRLDAWLNKDWARQAQVATVPSFVIYAPNGELLKRHEGSMTEPEFRAFVVAGKLAR